MKGVVNSFAIIKDQRELSATQYSRSQRVLEDTSERYPTVANCEGTTLPPCGLVHTEVIPPIRDLIFLSQKSENGCEGGEQAGKS